MPVMINTSSRTHANPRNRVAAFLRNIRPSCGGSVPLLSGTSTATRKIAPPTQAIEARMWRRIVMKSQIGKNYPPIWYISIFFRGEEDSWS